MSALGGGGSRGISSPLLHRSRKLGKLGTTVPFFHSGRDLQPAAVRKRSKAEFGERLAYWKLGQKPISLTSEAPLVSMELTVSAKRTQGECPTVASRPARIYRERVGPPPLSTSSPIEMEDGDEGPANRIR